MTDIASRERAAGLTHIARVQPQADHEDAGINLTDIVRERKSCCCADRRRID
jgi:hypothetical protein